MVGKVRSLPNRRVSSVPLLYLSRKKCDNDLETLMFLLIRAALKSRCIRAAAVAMWRPLLHLMLSVRKLERLTLCLACACLKLSIGISGLLGFENVNP